MFSAIPSMPFGDLRRHPGAPRRRRCRPRIGPSCSRNSSEGGQTGYRDQYANAEDRAEAVRSELAQFKEGKAKQPCAASSVGCPTTTRRWKTPFAWRPQGGDRERHEKQQAASLAKNITVNFNRKGQMATQVGALYAFFNASARHGADCRNPVRQERGQYQGGEAVEDRQEDHRRGVAFGSDAKPSSGCRRFDDDEPPEFVRGAQPGHADWRRKYLTLAMPLGFHVLPGIGRIATEFVLSGGKDPAKKAASFVSMFAKPSTRSETPASRCRRLPFRGRSVRRPC